MILLLPGANFKKIYILKIIYKLNKQTIKHKKNRSWGDLKDQIQLDTAETFISLQLKNSLMETEENV